MICLLTENPHIIMYFYAKATLSQIGSKFRRKYKSDQFILFFSQMLFLTIESALLVATICFRRNTMDSPWAMLKKRTATTVLVIFRTVFEFDGKINFSFFLTFFHANYKILKATLCSNWLFRGIDWAGCLHLFMKANWRVIHHRLSILDRPRDANLSTAAPVYSEIWN